MSKRFPLAFAVLLLGLVASKAVFAYTLSLSPPNQSVLRGGQAAVEVGVLGIEPGGVGSYQFTIAYDPSILSFDSYLDGGSLGIALGPGTTANLGSISIADTSLETDADALIAAQLLGLPPGGRLALGTLIFSTLGSGTSALDFSPLPELTDASGLPAAEIGLVSASVTVQQQGQAPEPGTIVLLGTAIAMLGAPRWRAFAHKLRAARR